MRGCGVSIFCHTCIHIDILAHLTYIHVFSVSSITFGKLQTSSYGDETVTFLLPLSHEGQIYGEHSL